MSNAISSICETLLKPHNESENVQMEANDHPFITPSGVVTLSRRTPMSTTATPSNEPPEKEHRLREYLAERVEDGEVYVKSKFIADDVGLSPKEIGALMVKLRESASDLEIEKWSYTSATTWRVTAA